MAINKSKSKMPFSESKCSLAKVSFNKTPAQAFTPPADEKKKIGTIWIFVYYAVYGSGRGRGRGR